ncbi:hypothetical protein ABPG75_013983 [Micractinium tetrahymenae]
MSACSSLDRAAAIAHSASKCSRAPGAAGRPTPCRRQALQRSRPTPQRTHASSSVSETAATPTFEQLYMQLAGVLAAPGSTVAAAATPLGRGLVATQPIEKGTTLLSVDYFNMLCITDEPAKGNVLGRRALEDWQLLHGRLPPLLNRYLLGDEGDWFVRLAAWLLWLKRNAAGPWRLYVDILPKESEMSCLMNYTEDELAELQSPLLESRARLERQQIAGLHDRLFSSTTGELRALQLADRLEDMLWAACMVNSRCFSDTVDGETVSLMVPCADMANHVLAPNAAYQFVPEADAFQLTALQDIPTGTEACISYGGTHKDNEALMRDYGFVIPGNVNDRVPFSAGDDVASRLAAAAAGGSGLLERPSLSAPRLLAALGLAPAAGAARFDLTKAAEAAMGDGEEHARTRRLLATLMSLQPFLRDIPGPGSGSGGSGSGGSPAAAAAAGPPPLTEQELQRERQSAAALAAQCAAALARMPTTAEADEALLAGAEGPLGPRRGAAVAARLESKRLIAAAQAALEAYGASLS